MSYLGRVIWYCNGAFMVAKGDGTDEYFGSIEDAMKWIENMKANGKVRASNVERDGRKDNDMNNANSTTDVLKLYDLNRQYDVYEPWLKENGFSLKDLPLAAVTADGENCLVDVCNDDGEIVWKISTFQKNGWTRINYYYRDGSTEEMYEK